MVSVALRVLCLRLKMTRIMPSHSVKFTGGGGLRSSIRTTRESTLGGGRKLFRFTCGGWMLIHEIVEEGGLVSTSLKSCSAGAVLLDTKVERLFATPEDHKRNNSTQQVLLKPTTWGRQALYQGAGTKEGSSGDGHRHSRGDTALRLRRLVQSVLLGDTPTGGGKRPRP